MKVIIELSNEVSITNTDNENEVQIKMSIGESLMWTTLNIDDLKLAIRKLTAK